MRVAILPLVAESPLLPPPSLFSPRISSEKNHLIAVVRPVRFHAGARSLHRFHSHGRNGSEPLPTATVRDHQHAQSKCGRCSLSLARGGGRKPGSDRNQLPSQPSGRRLQPMDRAITLDDCQSSAHASRCRDLEREEDEVRTSWRQQPEVAEFLGSHHLVHRCSVVR
jgi:hypothetical protein